MEICEKVNEEHFASYHAATEKLKECERDRDRLRDELSEIRSLKVVTKPQICLR